MKGVTEKYFGRESRSGDTGGFKNFDSLEKSGLYSHNLAVEMSLEAARIRACATRRCPVHVDAPLDSKW